MKTGSVLPLERSRLGRICSGVREINRLIGMQSTDMALKTGIAPEAATGSGGPSFKILGVSIGSMLMLAGCATQPGVQHASFGGSSYDPRLGV